MAHRENHDVSFVAVARAPIEEIEIIRKRMGRKFPWVSSFANDFNYDFHASFRPEEMEAGTAFYNYRYWKVGLPYLSGNSVFFKDKDGQIFHTYSMYGRGGEATEFRKKQRVL